MWLLTVLPSNHANAAIICAVHFMCHNDMPLYGFCKLLSLSAYCLELSTSECFGASPTEQVSFAMPRLTSTVSMSYISARLCSNSCNHSCMQIDILGKKVRIGGIAKGSGMIHPNMATLLSVITTDANVDPSLWHTILLHGVQKSFNQVCTRPAKLP